MWRASKIILLVAAIFVLSFGKTALAADYLMYVVLDKTTQMALIDPDTLSVLSYTELPVKGTHGATYSPDKQYMYINAMPPGDIVEYDIAGNGVSKWYPMETTKNCGILVAPDGKTVISASQNKKVIFLDRVTGKHRALKMPSDSHQFMFHKGKIWVAGGNGNAVHVIDLKSRKLLGSVKVGKVPHGLAFSPDGSKVLVSLRGENRVAIYDAGSFQPGKAAKEIGSIPVKVSDGGLCNITLMPDNKSYWVAETFGRTICQISASSNEVKAHMQVAGEPHHILPLK